MAAIVFILRGGRCGGCGASTIAGKLPARRTSGGGALVKRAATCGAAFSTQAGRNSVGRAERVGSMSIHPIAPDAPLAARAGCGDRRHCREPSEIASRRHPVDDGSCPAHRLFGGFRRAASNAQPRLPATCNGPCSPAPARRLALWCSRLPPTSFQASTRLLRPSRGGSRLGAVRRAATPRTSRR